MSDKLLCPLLNKSCIEARCKWWIHILGEDPQTGVLQDRYDCAISWLPILTIENTKHHRHTGAAVESLRNELTNASHELSLAVENAAKLKFNGEIHESIIHPK
jgi:hypothetical protein